MSATVDEIANKTFDYVIIGGGTAGLTLAARLAEDHSTTVAVLEAGSPNLNDPKILIPGQFGTHFMDPKYDWNFTTVPQKHSDNRSYFWPRGKGLGGSSAINLYVWSIPPAQDINAWEKLGNPGWNWKRYREGLKKTETFNPPKDENARLYKQVFNPEAHGYKGALQTSFPEWVMEGEVQFQETVLSTGIKLAKDPMNGDPIGTFMAMASIDPRTFTRSYAATAYYEPNKDKANLRVLCDSLVHRIITKTTGNENGLVEATGVEFENQGKVYTVNARSDIILSAGALKSPQILELSGIGDPRILGPLDIQHLIDLPGVGANMQEHIFTSLIFELDSSLNIETLDKLSDKAFAEQQLALHAEGKGIHRFGLSGFTFVPLASITTTPEEAKELIKRQRKRIQTRKESGELSGSLQKQFELQLTDYENSNGGDVEIVCIPYYFAPSGGEPGKAYLSIATCLNHPFSRGTIHATNNDPHCAPEIDPHYFEDKFDLELLVEMIKFGRRLSNSEPLKNMILKEVAPGPSCISDEQMGDYVKESLSTTFHTSSSLSMLPRDLNGVVDSSLRVYGTNNIRVVDLSIAPLQVSAHTQATVYSIAHQAADMIQKEIAESKGASL